MSSAAVAAHPSASVPASVIDDLDLAIDRAAAALRREQRTDGHFAFDLEADATIPAEYVMLKHFLGEADAAVEGKIGNYLRRTQEAHGGWPLLHRGPLNVSASVKAYVALRMVGDAVDAPHMVRARDAILAAGGAAHSNVFTPNEPRALRHGAVARRPGDADRDHERALVVPVPHLPDLVLGARHAGAAAGPDGAETPGREPAGH